MNIWTDNSNFTVCYQQIIELQEHMCTNSMYFGLDCRYEDVHILHQSLWIHSFYAIFVLSLKWVQCTSSKLTKTGLYESRCIIVHYKVSRYIILICKSINIDKFSCLSTLCAFWVEFKVHHHSSLLFWYIWSKFLQSAQLFHSPTVYIDNLSKSILGGTPIYNRCGWTVPNFQRGIRWGNKSQRGVFGERWDFTHKKGVFQWQNFKWTVFFHKFGGNLLKIFVQFCHFWSKIKNMGLWGT